MEDLTNDQAAGQDLAVRGGRQLPAQPFKELPPLRNGSLWGVCPYRLS